MGGRAQLWWWWRGTGGGGGGGSEMGGAGRFVRKMIWRTERQAALWWVGPSPFVLDTDYPLGNSVWITNTFLVTSQGTLLLNLSKDTHTHKWYQKLTIFASVNQYTDDRNSYTDDRNGYLNDLNQYTDDKNGYLNDPRSTILHSPQWECPVCPPLAASQAFQLAHGRNINAQKILGQLVWPFFSQWLSWGPLKSPC